MKVSQLAKDFGTATMSVGVTGFSCITALGAVELIDLAIKSMDISMDSEDLNKFRLFVSLMTCYDVGVRGRQNVKDVEIWFLVSLLTTAITNYAAPNVGKKLVDAFALVTSMFLLGLSINKLSQRFEESANNDQNSEENMSMVICRQ
jgi:hypothetical protein